MATQKNTLNVIFPPCSPPCRQLLKTNSEITYSIYGSPQLAGPWGLAHASTDQRNEDEEGRAEGKGPGAQRTPSCGVTRHRAGSAASTHRGLRRPCPAALPARRTCGPAAAHSPPPGRWLRGSVTTAAARLCCRRSPARRGAAAAERGRGPPRWGRRRRQPGRLRRERGKLPRSPAEGEGRAGGCSAVSGTGVGCQKLRAAARLERIGHSEQQHPHPPPAAAELRRRGAAAQDGGPRAFPQRSPGASSPAAALPRVAEVLSPGSRWRLRRDR